MRRFIVPTFSGHYFWSFSQHAQGLTRALRHITVMRMNVSDEILAGAAANGDAQAFSALLARHYDGLFRLAFRLTGARAEAEDLTQDICAALPAKLAGFRADARFTTWLWRVAVNAAHDRRRRAATHARHADGWGDWEVNRRATDAETARAIDWLTQTMRALSDDLRDTLALVLDGATHAQAAEVLGVSEGTISWRMSEAKKRLRALKEQEDQS
jgi:RNA polymerase sigma-70 factor, ECF subfamily